MIFGTTNTRQVRGGPSGRRGSAAGDVVAQFNTPSGSGSYTPTIPVDVCIAAWGGGGSGQQNVGSCPGGSGAAAGYKVLKMYPGQTLSWSVGAGGAASGGGNGLPGDDTTVTLPNGVVLTAKGGLGGAGASVSGGPATPGWDISRAGGAGGNNAGTNGAAATPGGGAGGVGSGTFGGGGGGAGFSDIKIGFNGGTGANGNSATPTGNGAGGCGCPISALTGGPGRVIVIATVSRDN
jgi:hypothetical protein